jgi:hypothetical protein
LLGKSIPHLNCHFENNHFEEFFFVNFFSFFYSPKDVLLMLQVFNKCRLKADLKTIQILEKFYSDYRQKVNIFFRQNVWKLI